MEEEKSSFCLIEKHLNRYLKLTRGSTSNSRQVERAYSTLKDLLIVEIYFMKSVRDILSDDEMSGFILFLENRLRPIIDSFDGSRGVTFMNFLNIALTRKAFTYLKDLKKKDLIDTCYINFYYPYEGTYVSEEPSPEDYVLAKEKSWEEPVCEVLPTDRLRYICACKPTRQKRMFIFICTLLPFLSNDTIEAICSILNFDKTQTFAIANHLFSSKENPKRSGRSYLDLRRDFFWTKAMEIESTIRMGDKSEQAQKRLIYNKQMLQKTENHEKALKKRISYPEISKTLNIKESTVAAAVFDTKRILKLVTEEKINTEGVIGKLFDCMDFQIKRAKIEVFEPFKEFRIAPEIVQVSRLNTCGK